MPHASKPALLTATRPGGGRPVPRAAPGTLPVQRITRAVVQDVRAFSADQEQTDDISVLALRWVGPVDLANDQSDPIRATEILSRPHLTS